MQMARLGAAGSADTGGGGWQKWLSSFPASLALLIEPVLGLHLTRFKGDEDIPAAMTRVARNRRVAFRLMPRRPRPAQSSVWR
jgi:hypothetical protein